MSRNRVRLADVARHAGVSPATVSRAISQPDLLSPETLVRVRRAAETLGYRPDAAARALASGRSMTVGAVMPTLENAIFSKALQAMHRTLAAEGYQLLVASHDYNPSAEVEAIRTLLARGVDGLILVGAARAPEATALLAVAAAPVVFTWCAPPGAAGVVVDNALAGAMAARHLIELGHRRIGVITGSVRFNDRQRARLAGVRAGLAEAGLSLPASLACEQATSVAGGRMGCASLFELAEPPTAIIGGIDLVAIGCIVEAQARGLSVPGDLSVASIDDLDMSAHIAPSLTTVHIPTTRIGADAASKIVAMLRGEAGPSIDCLPIELIIRRSSGRIAP
ncbi:MAG: LacI family DNA-binding transcriptional regulator [Methylobacteriaceae bacterium]|nr:LacI family DNA-binding transcriptional regulator [Methylobacteriaceae bacterium]